MRQGCTVAAAALIAGFGLIPATVEAACDPHTQADCTASPQPANVPPANAQPASPQPANAQPRSAAPLQLKRFMAGSPARKSTRRSVSRARLPRVVRLPPARPQRTDGSDAAQPAAKAIATVPVQAPAVALTASDHTVGFAAAAEHWRGDGTLALAPEREEVALPPGVTLAARFDEVNAIDLAADAAADPVRPGTSESMAGVALVTPASAAPSLQPAASPPPTETEPKPEDTSWLSWLYSKVVDGLLTVALAIRSLFA